MARILDGEALASELRDDLRDAIDHLAESDARPGLASKSRVAIC
jgi:methylenetetrahydrofolate dehydrogenase (NADP+)/methenyltetrahydrofolate cyclohydrolase